MSIHIGPYTFDHVRYDADADVLYLSIGDPVGLPLTSTRPPMATPSDSINGVRS